MPIREWLVQELTHAPQLECLSTTSAKEAFQRSPNTKHSAKYTGLRFTTFTNGSEMLVHARQNLRCIKGEAVEGFCQWRKSVHSLADSAPLPDPDELTLYLLQQDQDTDFGMATGNSSNQGSSEEQNPAREFAWLIGDCVDMSSFNGQALPGWLLDNIYRSISRSRLWDKGERDVGLPENVWESLRAWDAANNVQLQNA